MSTERAMNAQISEESDDLGDSDSVRCDVYLPIELIQRILFYADEKTLLNCQLVCKSWNQIILNYVWRKKAEIKTGHKFAIKTVLNWKDFYLICAKNLFGRNLLKNHSGAEGFKYWDYIGHRGDSDSESEFEVDDINNDDDHSESESESNTESNNENESNTESENENAANNNNNNQNNRNANGNANENGRNRVNENHSDYETDSSSESDEVIYQDSDDNEDQPDKIRGWMVECPPIGAPPPPSKPEFEGKKHCFVTTFYDCHKKQIIDLLKEGFSANILDQMRPPIAVNEWYCCRYDCPAYYIIRVRLMNQSNRILYEYVFQDVLEGDRQNVWFNVKHEFKSYGRGLRKICFIHGGRDRRRWAGQYGSKMAGAFVKAKIPDNF